MKELLIIIVIALAGATANAQKTNISLKELPTAAQTFITSHFKDNRASYIVKDEEIMETEYKVVFNGGIKIEFDGEGNWEEVKGNGATLPLGILPAAIKNYLDEHHKTLGVIKMEKDKKGYELELSNGAELEFDTAGKFLKMEM